MAKTTKNNYHLTLGQNLHIDRILAIYPDDQEIFRIDGKVVLKPKGTTLEEAQNG
jgi:hypothetical protein